MGDRLKVRAELKFGQTSTDENLREIIEPSVSDLHELFEYLTRYSASVLTVERLDDPGEGWLQVSRLLDAQSRLGDYQLERRDQIPGDMHRVVINSTSRSTEMVVDWARTDVISGVPFGGVDWELILLPDFDGPEDAVYFEFGSETGKAIDLAEPPEFEFLDPARLESQVKVALAKAWTEIWSNHAEESIYGFGLDTIGDPFLLPTAFSEAGYTSIGEKHQGSRWTPAESPLHLIGEEYFAAVNETIGQAMKAYGAWEDSFDGTVLVGDVRVEVDEMEVHGQMVHAIFEAGIGALVELRAEGLFASASAVVLNLWHMNPEPAEAEIVARCNPPEIASQFLAER